MPGGISSATSWDVAKELDANVNFPMIHLLCYWVNKIRRYGALQHYSGERHEAKHSTNLKDSWNASNHNLHDLLEVITSQRCNHCFEIRELNLQAIA
jgi:hypothetical protein